MDCHFAVKVSMLIDGELSEAESKQVRAHMAACEACRNLEQDFLFFRRQLKESLPDAAVEPSTAADFAPRRRRSFWKSGVSIPAPVFAGAILILFGLFIWTLATSIYRREEATAEKPRAGGSLPNSEKPRDGASLSRFDKGGRAEIYVARPGEK